MVHTESLRQQNPKVDTTVRQLGNVQPAQEIWRILCISAYTQHCSSSYLINSKIRNIFKQQIWRFLAHVQKLWKSATTSVDFFPTVRLSVRMKKLGSHWGEGGRFSWNLIFEISGFIVT